MRTKKLLDACEEIATQCIASRLRQLNRVITGIYDEALRPHGLTLNQLNILVFVSKRRITTPSAIARFLSMDRSTVSRSLERLQKGRWVLVHQGMDARQRKIRLSQAGENLLVRTLPAWREAQQKAVQLLQEPSAGAIAAAVNRVRSEISRA
jgi:DNA-binding MarR family transcriptional regulator